MTFLTVTFRTWTCPSDQLASRYDKKGEAKDPLPVPARNMSTFQNRPSFTFVGRLHGHTDSINCLAVSEDGSFLASGGMLPFLAEAHEAHCYSLTKGATQCGYGT